MNKKFWKHYRLFIITMLIVIFILLTVFWTFLYAYEKSRPEYAIQNISKLFQKGKTNKLSEYIKIEGKYNSEKSIDKYLKNDLKDSKISYEKKRGEFKNNKPVYSILNGDKEIAVVKLKKSSKKGLFNTVKWDIKNIDYHFKKEQLTIIAKTDEKILVNGIELSKEEITDNNYYLEKLKNVLQFVQLPSLVKYELNDVYDGAVVQYKDGSYLKDEYTYYYIYPSNDQILNEQKDFLIEWCKDYTKYVVNEGTFGSISGSVVSSSHAYSFLKTVANTNIWLAAHTPTAFSDFSFDNMQMYQDDLYSVDIKYNYSFYVNGDLKEYQTNLTLYLIEVNGNWYIADLTI